MKVEKRRKMYVIFFFSLKAPLEHPRIPSPWTQPSSRGIMGVVVRLQAPALRLSRPGCEEGANPRSPMGRSSQYRGRTLRSWEFKLSIPGGDATR